MMAPPPAGVRIVVDVSDIHVLPDPIYARCWSFFAYDQMASIEDLAKFIRRRFEISRKIVFSLLLNGAVLLPDEPVHVLHDGDVVLVRKVDLASNVKSKKAQALPSISNGTKHVEERHKKEKCKKRKRSEEESKDEEIPVAANSVKLWCKITNEPSSGTSAKKIKTDSRSCKIGERSETKTKCESNEKKLNGHDVEKPPPKTKEKQPSSSVQQTSKAVVNEKVVGHEKQTIEQEGTSSDKKATGNKEVNKVQLKNTSPVIDAPPLKQPIANTTTPTSVEKQNTNQQRCATNVNVSSEHVFKMPFKRTRRGSKKKEMNSPTFVQKEMNSPTFVQKEMNRPTFVQKETNRPTFVQKETNRRSPIFASPEEICRRIQLVRLFREQHGKSQNMEPPYKVLEQTRASGAVQDSTMKAASATKDADIENADANTSEECSKDFTSLPNLVGIPRADDKIAFQELELSENYTPQVSPFREAIVVSVNTQDSSIELKLINALRIPTAGKFSLDVDGPGYELVMQKTVLLSQMLNAKLLL